MRRVRVVSSVRFLASKQAQSILKQRNIPTILCSSSHTSRYTSPTVQYAEYATEGTPIVPGMSDKERLQFQELFGRPAVTDWETHPFNPNVVKAVELITEFNAMQFIEFTKLLQYKLKIDDAMIQGAFMTSQAMGMGMGMGMPMGGMAMGGGMPMQGMPGMGGPQETEEEKAQRLEEEKKKKEEEEEAAKNAPYMATLVAVDDAKKFNVLKEIRKLIPGMKLMESKEKVDKLPSKIKEVKLEEGEKLVTLFAELGGTLELKPLT
eukprot:TRINITY_DN174_c0_g1_i1.p1 TRINITY_DN174_c0_g1~~TRINITY_DN174_c0_g1_i1.p1  ORF type:complete len:264 (-),score=77.23 TRINITY_DN174_c0_g1_i1:119-910(-)